MITPARSPLLACTCSRVAWTIGAVLITTFLTPLGGSSLQSNVEESGQAPRIARYWRGPLKAQVEPGEMHVVIVDSGLTQGDGPLLGLPSKRPRFPGVLRDLVEMSQAIAIADATHIASDLVRDGTYVHSTIDLRIGELLKPGSIVMADKTIQTVQDGGTVTIGKTRVDLVPDHLQLYELGRRYLLFCEEHDGRAVVVLSYLVQPNGTLRALDRLPKPKGFGDQLDGRSLADITKRVRNYVAR